MPASSEIPVSERWVWGAIAVLAALAVLKLGSEFYRLVLDDGPHGAIDLAMRYFEIQQWFDGQPLYGSISNATYPPASFLILWPIAGWVSLQSARWLWLLLSIASLVWLVWLLVRECDTGSLAERYLVALIALSMNATGIAIGNGQLVIFILPLLIAILSLLRTGKSGWGTDLVIAVLFLLALVKPTVSAPFFLILLLVRPGYRVALACVTGYLLLTFSAALFQHQDMITLVGSWLLGATITSVQVATELDYGSVHSWLALAGLSGWNSLVSIGALFLLGVWIYRVRCVDPWLIFGVTALLARIWTYHGIYDDMLIIIPIIAVFRHSRKVAGQGQIELSSLLLLSGAVFVMLLPARLFNDWQAPWPGLYAGSHLFFWFLLLIYLVKAASKEIQMLSGRTDLA